MRRNNSHLAELNSAHAVRNARGKRTRRPLSAEALAAQEYVQRVMAERLASRTLPAFVLERMSKKGNE